LPSIEHTFDSLQISVAKSGRNIFLPPDSADSQKRGNFQEKTYRSFATRQANPLIQMASLIRSPRRKPGERGQRHVEQRDTADLVRGAAAGDERAWHQLVDRYSGFIWSIARGYRLDAADAADVVQTTWLRLLEHLDRLQDPARVAAWLATTTRRECQRTIRRSGRVVPTDNEQQLEPDQALTPTPEALALVSERDRALWAAFSRLPDNCQRLLRVVVAAPMPYDEVAAALGMPIGGIGPTRGRCLERLRRNLQAIGINAEVVDS
jgi:RNA polymerase sigma factor (sigma-70 family)